MDAIFLELWDELHHQGDVDLASYYAVPHLIRIARSRALFDYNVFALVAVIEAARHNDNPSLPEDLEPAYTEAIKTGVPELVKMGLLREWDLPLTSAVLSALAAAKGHSGLAGVIMGLDDPEMIAEIQDR